MGARWDVAYPLSTRHVEERMLERGVHVDHATINRWVVKYSPQLEEAFQRWTTDQGQPDFPATGAYRAGVTPDSVKDCWRYVGKQDAHRPSWHDTLLPASAYPSVCRPIPKAVLAMAPRVLPLPQLPQLPMGCWCSAHTRGPCSPGDHHVGHVPSPRPAWPAGPVARLGPRVAVPELWRTRFISR